MPSAPQHRSPGHTVLVVPVPELNDFVRARTEFYDASFLPADAGFVNAHITLLGPWIGAPTAADRAIVAAIARQVRPFDADLAEVAQFPDGTIHLVPSPAAPFTALTDLLVAAFPDHPPYGGAFDPPAPHLTLDRRTSTITVSSVRAALAPLLPTRTHVDRIDLQWWANDDCRLLASWPLGSSQAGG